MKTLSKLEMTKTQQALRRSRYSSSVIWGDRSEWNWYDQRGFFFSVDISSTRANPTMMYSCFPVVVAESDQLRTINEAVQFVKWNFF